MTEPQDIQQSTPEGTKSTAALTQTTEEPETPAGEISDAGGEHDGDSRGLFGFQAFLNVLVIVIFVITFIAQAFRVPSESMENTLLVGDFILADKLHYANDGGIWHFLLPYRPIRHGDIVVFHYPVDPSQYFVKRVIGLPGDRIHLNRGVVYRNGERLEENYVIHTSPYPNFYRDNFPAQQYMSPETSRMWRRQMLDHVKDGNLVVPPDSYFVMGDNRDSSLDSRYWGFVPRDSITARPLVIYMSVNEGGDEPTRAVSGKLIHSGHVLAHFLQLARWRRMFHLVR